MADLQPEHDYGSPDCWCEPDVLVICPVCEPDPESVPHPTREKAVLSMAEDADPGCWRCDGGGLCGPAEPWEREEEALLIVHRDVQVTPHA